jgi:hypothetical protein
MYYSNILGSALDFTSYFASLTLSLGFWGRNILKLAKIKQGVGFGEPLTLVAALAWLIWLAQALFPFVNDYEYYLKFFFYIGLAGAFIEIIICTIKAKKNAEINKTLIIYIVKQNESLIIALIFGLFLSLLYSAIWISGRPEIWMNNKADFYNWLILGENIRGGLDLNILEANHLYNKMKADNFGTNLILGFFGAVNAKSLLFSAPYCVITVLVWEATAIYFIIKRKISLKTTFAIILTFSIILSSLINYVAIFGFFGQIIATICFLTAVEQLNTNKLKINKLVNEIKIFGFPIFTLFISYQSGYFLYTFFVFYLYLCIKFFDNETDKINKRIYIALKKSIALFLSISLISFIIMPGIGYHLYIRTLEVAQQILGWPMPYLGPWLFSGLPFHQIGLLNNAPLYEPTEAKGYLYYVIFIFIIILLIINCFIAKKREINNAKAMINNNNILFSEKLPLNFVISLSVGYLATLTAYFVGAYLIAGNIYRVWKFATFTTLPISFIAPILILIFFSTSIFRKIKIIPVILIISVIACFLVKFILLPPLIELPTKYYNIHSAMPLLSQLQSVKSIIEKKKTILIHMIDPSKLFLTTLFLNDLTNSKLLFISGFYFDSNYDYFSIINGDTILLSNLNFENNIYNGSYIKDSFTTVFLYDNNKLNNIGYATLNSGDNPFVWEFNKILFFKIKIPNNLISKEVSLYINIITNDENKDGCNKLELGVVDDNDIAIWDEINIKSGQTAISQPFIATNTIKAVLLSDKKYACRYFIKDISVNLVMSQ